MIGHAFTVLGNQTESLRYSCVLYLTCCSDPKIDSTIRFCFSRRGKLRLRYHNSEMNKLSPSIANFSKYGRFLFGFPREPGLISYQFSYTKKMPG
jgi:hypothetical protein